MPPPGPALALDVGTRTIGVAVTDPARRHVFPVSTVARRSVRRDAEAIAELCRGRGVTQLVVGLSRDDDGAENRSAHLARQVAAAVVALVPVPVAWVDEGYTTVEAHTRLGAAGVRAADRKPMVDQLAAAVILELWLAGAGAPAPAE